MTLGGLALRAPGAAPQRPNILFIAVDDLRPELGCYGRDYIKSPNIDRIARQGMTFNRAYCQQAVCSPSRSSLLTGTRPDTTKVWDLVTHFRDALPDVVTLPQLFKQGGYFVQGMGKIYHPGFDDPRSWSVPWQAPKAPTYALLKTPKVKDEDKPKKKEGPPFESADVPDNFFKDGMVADLAVNTLRDLGKKPDPFFFA
ncbi:MAG: sulfatase-like hydrolase/transferase, partial [Acidobacteria bacterium]|nr:sulfatase-like hydrolase/transferase [Acidobacteriota bacterium]